eukprot:1395241-Amorphochlora_amoeboformis.AAC.1
MSAYGRSGHNDPNAGVGSDLVDMWDRGGTRFKTRECRPTVSGRAWFYPSLSFHLDDPPQRKYVHARSRGLNFGVVACWVERGERSKLG